MAVLFELVVIVLLTLISLLIFSKKEYNRRIFIVLVISYMFFYDFLNFHITEILEKELITFKLGIELFTISAFVKIFLIGKASKNSKVYLMLILFVLLWSLTIGFVGGSNVKSMYLDLRSLILPILLTISLIQNRIIESFDVKFLMNTVAALLLLNGIYSFIEFVTYTGEFQSYWRYQSLLKSKLGLNSDYNEGQLFYQIVRGEDIRSSGFIVSALAAGYLYGFIALYYMISALESIKISLKIRYFLYAAIFLAFSYLTQVRTSFLMVGGGLSIAFIMRLIKSNLLKSRLVYIIPIIIMAGLYFYLTSSLSLFKDASSQGRIVQYNTLISDFTITGKGLGSYPRSFDSYYIYTLLELGFIALILYFLFYKMMVNERLNRYSNLHVYTQFSIFLFICSFQHISGSLYYFLLLLIISKNDLIKKSQHLKHKVNYQTSDAYIY